MLHLARFSLRHPRRVLAILALLTVVLVAALPRLELRTDGAALHPRGDLTVERVARDRLAFADPEELILLITSRPGGPALSSAAGLRHLARLHREIANLPGIRAAGVRSAASVIDVARSGVGALGTFLDDLPEEEAALAERLGRLRARPLTDGLFLAADGRAAVIFAPLETGLPRRRLIGEVESFLAARGSVSGDTVSGDTVSGDTVSSDTVLGGAGFEHRLAGPVIAETLLGERILADLERLVPLMAGFVALLLLISLRTAGGLLVAMSKVGIVLAWTGGLMALLGIPITLVTTILPVLLLALCVIDEVHVLARLEDKLRAEAGTNAGTDAASAILPTLEELYRPVVYTSLSTAVGFLSFMSASIVPLRHFGLLAAVGILLAMGMTFTLTPALAVLVPRAWLLGRRSRAASRAAGAAKPRRGAAFALGILLLLASVPGLLRLSVQDAWIDNFDPASPLVKADRKINARFWGTYRHDMVLSAEPGYFHRPAGAALLAAVARAAAEAPHAGGVVSPLQPLDTVTELLGLASGAADLPADALRAVVEVAALHAQETGLERLLTADGSAARLLVLVNQADYARSRALAAHLERTLAPLLEGTGVSYHGSGDLPLATATVGAIVRDQLHSIAWTLFGVGILLYLVNRNLRLTLVQLIPPSAAAVLVLAGMGYVGWPLGVATSLFTALTIGVGVDFALHVTYAHDDARRRGLAPSAAVQEAFAITAGGRRWSTVVLASGFLVLTASAFAPNHRLGVLLAAAMVASFATTGLFVPWLLARERSPRS